MRIEHICLQSGRKKIDLIFMLFLLSAVLSVITTYYVSSHYIDSDTSSELILASHWIETGNIFSADWLYGSELRLFHVQLIYVPLMLLFEDWLTVRFLGALIMQIIYIASFGCLVYAAGKGKRFFFLGAALLLLTAFVFCWLEDTQSNDTSKSAFLKPANRNFLFCCSQKSSLQPSLSPSCCLVALLISAISTEATVSRKPTRA